MQQGSTELFLHKQECSKMAAASCQLTQISPCFVGLKIQKEEIKVSDVGLQHPTEMTFR